MAIRDGYLGPIESNHCPQCKTLWNRVKCRRCNWKKGDIISSGAKPKIKREWDWNRD